MPLHPSVITGAGKIASTGASRRVAADSLGAEIALSLGGRGRTTSPLPMMLPVRARNRLIVPRRAACPHDRRLILWVDVPKHNGVNPPQNLRPQFLGPQPQLLERCLQRHNKIPY